MKETVLYQRSASTGKGKVWKIRVDDKGTQSEIVIRSGAFNFETLEEGKLITNTAIVSVGKNIGKTNETTHYTQAVSEARAKIELKVREGYSDDIEKAKGSSSATLGSGIPKPMLAQKYHPTGAQNSSKTLKQMKIEGKKIIVQPKLDGNRCIILLRNGEGYMYTRKGDLMPVQLDHILTPLVLEFTYNQDTYDELILDGELYVDPTEMSFNELNGLIKKQSASDEQKERRKLIKYHLYDVMLDLGYEKRMEVIRPFGSDSVKVSDDPFLPIQLVESKEIIATDDNIQKELERWLGEGYEGLMIRVLDKGYENKRSWQLVKVKIFEDAEFKLVGFEEDVRGGFVGTFVLELPAPVTDRDGKVVTTFRAGASGQSVEDRTYMLNNPVEFLNKMATVEFFGRSEYGIPRFGKFKGVRDDV